MALLSGCAEFSAIDQRLHRVETIARYNHDRIEALSHRVSGIEGQALSPVRKASLERRTFPITLRFEEVSSRDPGQFACCLTIAVVGVVFDAILTGFLGAVGCGLFFYQVTRGRKENHIIHRLYAGGLIRYKGILPSPRRQSRYSR